MALMATGVMDAFGLQLVQPSEAHSPWMKASSAIIERDERLHHLLCPEEEQELLLPYP